MRLARNPFIIIVDDIPEEMENEFLSLVNNTPMKDVFKQEENISDFWAVISSQYPKIGIFSFESTFAIFINVFMRNVCAIFYIFEYKIKS